MELEAKLKQLEEDKVRLVGARSTSCNCIINQYYLLIINYNTKNLNNSCLFWQVVVLKLFLLLLLRSVWMEVFRGSVGSVSSTCSQYGLALRSIYAHGNSELHIGMLIIEYGL